jgi:UDP-N-acetylglucosamine 1-carboxyvinyltransferase
MDRLIIRGGRRLEGRISVSGSKNATLPLMAATLLCPETHKLANVPDLRDVHTMGNLLATLGAEYSFRATTLEIDTSSLKEFRAPYELVRTMRASVLVLGPLIARYGKAEVSLPGGCAIGARPINLHLEGLQKMGVEITLEFGYVKAKAKRLQGTDIYLDIPTVTGTENLMMAATLARGTTRIENAAKEPEVVNLAEALNSMGARIQGAGTDIIEIEGVEELRPLSHTVIPDRIEAATYITAVAITRGEALIEGARPEHLEAVIAKLRETGVDIKTEENRILVKAGSRPKASNIKTMPYPGFPTDMQAQFMALMSVAEGTSIIRETIFENRFMHVAELRRMGADIIVEGSTATVRGKERLNGAPLMATDLRASASLVIAALVAEGETVIDRVYHLDRGYEKIEEKLRAVGADIKRIST